MNNKKALEVMRTTGRRVRYAEAWARVFFQYTHHDKILALEPVSDCAANVINILTVDEFLEMTKGDIFGFTIYDKPVRRSKTKKTNDKSRRVRKRSKTKQ